MGKRVEVDVEFCDVESESGHMVPGVVVTCEDCGHATESCGEEPKSVRRCLALLREECPEGANAFYVDPDENDKD